jgi:hypothetical protein
MSRVRVKVNPSFTQVNVGPTQASKIIAKNTTAQNNQVLVATPGPQGPQGPAGNSTEEEMLDTEIDQTNPLVVYVGQAEPGTAKSAALWRIKRITESGTETSIDWAGGTSDFVHIWNNRTLLSYGP